ncbi:MAG TPA: N-acetylmuramoyl-L-alanine amidase [Chloroflexia bacterium]|nr:N-acetylmuramoyl-L-alanine amidase [Chloroflexia bacterium]
MPTVIPTLVVPTATAVVAITAPVTLPPPSATALPPIGTATQPPTPLPSPSATLGVLPSATATPRRVRATATVSPAPRRGSAVQVGTPSPRAAAPLVVLDPGHGGKETGAIGPDGLVEKDLNLVIARGAAARLRAAGIGVLLTRDADVEVNRPPVDVNGDGGIDVDDDLQARVDLANAAGAWLLVSIHNNADPRNPGERGTTTYYCADGTAAQESRRLADTLHTHLLAAIRGAGYTTGDRRVRDDAELGKPGGHLYLLGPHNTRIARPSLMPGALGETLFLSNQADAAQLAHPAMLDTLATGYAEGIRAYLDGLPPLP